MVQKKRLILGSVSAGRRKVLDDLKGELSYAVVPSGFDESRIRCTDPTQLTSELALAKAGAILARMKEPCVVITADQVVYFQGAIREKPRNIEEAREFLRSYGSGDAVRFVTTVCVTERTPERRIRQLHDTDDAFVEFRPIPESVMDDVIARGEVLQCAGAVVLEDPSISPHVRHVWNAYGTQDARTSVMGLPRYRTLKMLTQLGVL